MIIVVRNPTFIAHVISEGMRLGIEAYNNHLWLSSLFHHYPLQLYNSPFFHFPTWEMLLLNPLFPSQSPIQNHDSLIYPTQFFSTQIMETTLFPWPNQSAAINAHLTNPEIAQDR